MGRCAIWWVAILYNAWLTFNIIKWKVTWYRFFTALEVFVDWTALIAGRMSTLTELAFRWSTRWVRTGRWLMESAAADTAWWVATVWSCVTIFLAIYTLTNYIGFKWFLYFNFCMKQWRELEYIIWIRDFGEVGLGEIERFF